MPQGVFMSSENMSVDFDALTPKSLGGGQKLKTFTVVGKDLTEKQAKAGYYRQINGGDKIDGIFNGITKDERSEFNTSDVAILGLDGSETIVKSCASLSRQLADIEIGTPVRLIYQGKVKLTKGPGKNKEVQNWLVNS